MRLLHSISEEDASRPETYAMLIRSLDHDNLVIRDLAFWHLALLVPDGAKTIPYDPTADAEKRQQACVRWKQLVPDGRLPAKSTPIKEK